MKQIIFKPTNKVIEIGKPFSFNLEDESCSMRWSSNKLTQSIVDILNEFNLIEYKEVKDTPVNDLEFYINKVMKRFNFTADQWNKIFLVSPSVTASMLLKEIALNLDKKYKDHISNSNDIYGFSLSSGRLTRIEKKTIRSYKNFAAFRTLEDANYALYLISPVLKKMYELTN